MASQIAAKGGRAAADAQQTQLYAEYSLFTIAQQTTDPPRKLEMLISLQERNPKSPYAENVPAECFAIYHKLNQMEKALALADQTLAADPDNIDMLMAVSGYHFGREESKEKVVANMVHVVEVLGKKPRPDSLGEEDWAKKKSQVLGSAYYMGGVFSSVTGQYGRADCDVARVAAADRGRRDAGGDRVLSTGRGELSSGGQGSFAGQRSAGVPGEDARRSKLTFSGAGDEERGVREERV